MILVYHMAAGTSNDYDLNDTLPHLCYSSHSCRQWFTRHNKCFCNIYCSCFFC